MFRIFPTVLELCTNKSCDRPYPLNYMFVVFECYCIISIILFLIVFLQPIDINEFKRSSNIPESIFNLVNSIVGGGIIGNNDNHNSAESLFSFCCTDVPKYLVQ